MKSRTHDNIVLKCDAFGLLLNSYLDCGLLEQANLII